MTDQQTKYDHFRTLHQGEGVFVIPNPWDAGTARILAAMGFQALATTSAGYAFSVGHTDSGLGRDGVLANAKAIVEASDLPVSADLQDGFGARPEDCAETIRLALACGLVGGSIEDGTGDSANPIHDFDHAVDRVRAAVEAAKGQPFLLTARAENYLNGRPDLADTIRRLQAFSLAGADVLYAPGLSDMEDIRTLCREVDKPVNVLAGANFSVSALAEAGVKRISVGSSFTQAALSVMMRAATEVRDNGTFTYIKDSVSFGTISGFMSNERG